MLYICNDNYKILILFYLLNCPPLLGNFFLMLFFFNSLHTCWVCLDVYCGWKCGCTTKGLSKTC